ncbi:MAG: amino acid--tRNA ligase-related protein [Weeksellaceae bacterium]
MSKQTVPNVVHKKNEESLIPIIDPKKFSFVINKMRTFFLSKGFLEVHTQNRISIMAACENPHSISSYTFDNKLLPLPQTGQMWLEYELLKDPTAVGFFCVSTSFRNEKNPIPGRHDRIFPMFEFEMPGNIDTLLEFEKELVEYLGFGNKDDFPVATYEEMSDKYSVSIIESDDELEIQKDYGNVFFLTKFPERTFPFWNMKRNEDGTSNKIDVLLHGMETIGSAERSCDADEQRKSFYSIEDGKYAQKLFDLFGQAQVEEELEEFLAQDFFPRSGGGIGVTRMIRAMELSGLMPE